MPSLPRPGDRLAGFRIERELGHGTTGIVFLAHQEALDRRVALKVVGRPLAADAAFRERFRHEARAVAGLDHPNVVQILETGEDDAHLWLAMRLVDGPDLRVLLRRTGRLDPEQAVAVVEQVAAALDAAHAAGLVHRDVKPGNVLIEDGPGRDLHVELADFGLARAPGVDDAEGTPGYAAPEQLAGTEAGPAADVFALGCVLFELLTGTAPPTPAPAPDQNVPWRRGASGTAATGSGVGGTVESEAGGAAAGSDLGDADRGGPAASGPGGAVPGGAPATDAGGPGGVDATDAGETDAGREQADPAADGGDAGPAVEGAEVVADSGGARSHDVGDDDPTGAGAGPAAAAAYATLLPLTPSAALPRLGGAFDPAVERATAADPAARFASAGEFAMWARAALTVPSVGPDPADPVRIAAATPAGPAEIGPAAPTWEIPPARRSRRRGRKVLVALFLAVVLALLGTAFVFIGSLGDTSRDRQAGTTPGAPAPAGGGGSSSSGGSGSGSTGAGGSGSGGAGGSSAGGTGSGGTGGSSAGGTAPGAGADGTRGGSGSGSGARSGAAGGGRAGSGGGAAGAGGSGTTAGGSGAGATGAGGSGTRANGTGGPGPGGTNGRGSGANGASGNGGSGSGSSGGAGSGSGGAGSAGSGSSAGRGSASAGAGTGGSGAAGPTGVPNAGRRAPRGAATAPLPPVPAGNLRFGGGNWVLDLPAAEGWRQTATQELDGGTRLVTRLLRPDAVRIVVESLPGRTAVVATPGARAFPVRLPDAGRTDGALYRGGRYAMCADGVCAALPANGPNGGVLLIVGARREAGAKRVARRAAAGLRVR